MPSIFFGNNNSILAIVEGVSKISRLTNGHFHGGKKVVFFLKCNNQFHSDYDNLKKYLAKSNANDKVE